MNPDRFEEELSRQPLREIPADWRAEILGYAQAAVATAPVEPPRWKFTWRELLWPCPQVWAGIAAVWVVVVGLEAGLANADTSAMMASGKPSLELQVVWREQRELLSSLLSDRVEPVVTEPRRRPVPGRSSQLTIPTVVV